MADSKDILICPACGKEMTKISVDDENFSVDICLDGCGGLLFDNREFEKISKSTEKIDNFIKKLEDRTFETVDTTKLIKCPVCNANMMKSNTGHGNVVIDLCATCGAKFLNNKELVTIRHNEKRELDSKTATIIDEAISYSKPLQHSDGRNFVINIVKKFI